MKTVKLTYFKPSGKYYSEGIYNSEQAFDFDIYPEVRNWASQDIEPNSLSLPGLISKRWSGYILVSGGEVVPALIDVTEVSV